MIERRYGRCRTIPQDGRHLRMFPQSSINGNGFFTRDGKA